jgi:hypothetical protein
VELASSRLEGHGPALFIKGFKSVTKAEIAHLHIDAEGSAHAVLSYKDAKQVIEKEWGERHPLSGKGIPLSYVILYAPRNEEEIAIMSDIFRAGVAYMCAEEPQNKLQKIENGNKSLLSS